MAIAPYIVHITKTGPITKVKEYCGQLSVWATDHCASYIDYTLEDLSYSGQFHQYTLHYQFNMPHDATMFTLKWKTS